MYIKVNLPKYYKNKRKICKLSQWKEKNSTLAKKKRIRFIYLWEIWNLEKKVENLTMLISDNFLSRWEIKPFITKSSYSKMSKYTFWFIYCY